MLLEDEYPERTLAYEFAMREYVRPVRGGRSTNPAVRDERSGALLHGMYHSATWGRNTVHIYPRRCSEGQQGVLVTYLKVLDRQRIKTGLR